MNKTRFPLGIVFGLMIVLFTISCDTDATDDDQEIPFDDQNITLVCLGNSLTAGYGAVTPGEDDKTKSYPAYLQEKIDNSVTNGKVTVINAGVSGDTTLDGLSRIDEDVLSKNPQIVIIELGANDLDLTKNPPVNTRENLQEIVKKLDNGKRKIYVAKFYTEEVARATAANFGITDPVLQTFLIKQYDDIFNELASSNNVELIEDIWTGVWGIHMSDSVHPNAAGYEIMADHYFKALQPYLQEHGRFQSVKPARFHN
jgi:lysophospholipase L1-like esterase